MKVDFRCDATPAIGGGHVMRCLTLADALARLGASVSFVVNAEASRIVPALGRARHSIEVIANATDASSLAEQRGKADIVVFDSYDMDETIERPMRRWAKKIVVIDDLANRRHDCDLLIDATFGRSASDYRNLLPSGSEVLAGPRFSLLRPEFAAIREESLARRAKRGGVERILVSLGLTDLGGVTARVVAALLQRPLQARIDAVIGPDAASRNELEIIGARDPRMMLHVDPPNMARLIADSDVAIGAGGGTSWERCCLGAPTVLLVLADNQRLLAGKLEEVGALLVARGAHETDLAETDLTEADLTEADSAEADLADLVEKVCFVVERPDKRHEMSVIAAAIVDGRGTERVAEKILGLLEQGKSG